MAGAQGWPLASSTAARGRCSRCMGGMAGQQAWAAQPILSTAGTRGADKKLTF